MTFWSIFPALTGITELLLILYFVFYWCIDTFDYYLFCVQISIYVLQITDKDRPYAFAVVTIQLTSIREYLLVLPFTTLTMVFWAKSQSQYHNVRWIQPKIYCISLLITINFLFITALVCTSTIRSLTFFVVYGMLLPFKYLTIIIPKYFV